MAKFAATGFILFYTRVFYLAYLENVITSSKEVAILHGHNLTHNIVN